METTKTIKLEPGWRGLLNAFLAVYECGNRAYAREQLERMAKAADFGVRAQAALTRIADMTDRDGNAIEMHRDELRAIARTVINSGN
ncbi:conserved hypothetical protein [Burkholderia latens]|uniref:hypothetical protein n=1 Tax=Burkholderia latens TaxID=488446 RepID=UPI0039A61896